MTINLIKLMLTLKVGILYQNDMYTKNGLVLHNDMNHTQREEI